jgi:uncharacterized protein (TIGR03435 family)
MFERLTERARRVLFFARDEASQFGSSSMDTEHLLLGLIREGVVRRLPARPPTSPSKEIPFSPAAMRVLQHTAEQADRLSHDYIGTEHLLLGLLREQGSIAADVLSSRGLLVDRVRDRIAELLLDGEPAERSEPPGIHSATLELIADVLSDGERPGRPGPPGVPANTFQWPWLRFVPSRTVHILYSDLKPPQQPVTNASGPGLQAYGYTLTEAIINAWRGNRWHIDVADGLDDGTRYDFHIQFAQTEPDETFQQTWRGAIEQQFDLAVTRETRPRDVWIARRTGLCEPMLRYYGEWAPGTAVPTGPFNLVMRRPHDAPLFPLEAFAVHSVPFFYLARWFEEFLGGPVVDQTGLSGLYGFELTRPVATRDELIDRLRDQAGVSITRERHDTPTLVVRHR